MFPGGFAQKFQQWQILVGWMVENIVLLLQSGGVLGELVYMAAWFGAALTIFKISQTFNRFNFCRRLLLVH